MKVKTTDRRAWVKGELQKIVPIKSIQQLPEDVKIEALTVKEIIYRYFDKTFKVYLFGGYVKQRHTKVIPDVDIYIYKDCDQSIDVLGKLDQVLRELKKVDFKHKIDLRFYPFHDEHKLKL